MHPRQEHRGPLTGMKTGGDLRLRSANASERCRQEAHVGETKHRRRLRSVRHVGQLAPDLEGNDHVLEHGAEQVEPSNARQHNDGRRIGHRDGAADGQGTSSCWISAASQLSHERCDRRRASSPRSPGGIVGDGIASTRRAPVAARKAQ
jgi:hypothetical protein